MSEALALGQGEVVDELASGLGLDEAEHVALGKLLRKERRVLGDLADPGNLTLERAARFARHLADSMMGDATLRPALERNVSAS